jgi:hypothetical protein
MKAQQGTGGRVLLGVCEGIRWQFVVGGDAVVEEYAWPSRLEDDRGRAILT